LQKDEKMSIKRDENVLAGKKTPSVIPIETKATVTNTQTGEEYASEIDAQADVKNPATSTEEEHIKRDVAITVNSLDIFGEVMN
jgi:hypothetical protein|tara:strand:- start:262 stop:513 length:252 start_codon:yes stop_codon:yes gene_type:complete